VPISSISAPGVQRWLTSFLRGSQLTPVDLAGSIAIVQTSTGLEVRSAASGQALAEIVAAPSFE